MSAAITVVICVYADRRYEQAIAAVDSIAAQTVAANPLVVVDHNPELGARLRDARPHVRIIDNNGARGLSSARNAGVAATKTPLIGFLDDDARAEPDWLARLLPHFEQENVLGAGGRIEPVWEMRAPRWMPEEFLWVVGCTWRGTPVGVADVRNLIGAGMLMRRKVFDLCGGFAEDLGRKQNGLPAGAEETEFCIRAARRIPGGRFVYDPAARIGHCVAPDRNRLAYFLGRCYAEGRSKAALTRLSVGLASLSSESDYVRRVLPAALARDARKALLDGDVSAAGRAAAIVAGLAAAGAGFALGRARTNRLRPVRDLGAVSR